MRLKLTLQKVGEASLLPINYNYELSAWIYSRIQAADKEYADFLHNQGYTIGSRSFKLFTFSTLQVPNYRLQGDRMEILSEQVSLVVSFWLEAPSEKFVIGLFQNQHLQLGDRFSQVSWRVQQVESLPWTLPPETCCFRTLSPLTVSRKNERGFDDYLPPDDPDFQNWLLTNLLGKYTAHHQVVPSEWQNYPFAFRLLSPQAKPRLITLKAHTQEQTRVKGYMFDFELTAPSALLEAGYLAGFGRYNAEGFGCVEVLNKKFNSSLY
jgi:CRISPR-associated endoribonuclease Cas6